MDERIQMGVDAINKESVRKVDEWLMTGVIVNEQSVDWDPPLIEIKDEIVVIHERLRFL